MTSVAILAPFADQDAIELGGHLWRKQVIRHGDFRYRDPNTGEERTLHFTPDYTASLAQAYREAAYDAVPLQFADASNAHTNAVEATRGEILGMEPSSDGTGLDAIVRLSDDGEKAIRNYPKLPVSVRIIENLDRADGKRWPAAVQHVLATWDPRITGMSPWERVDLTGDDVTDVIDLTVAPDGTEQEGATVPEIADQLTPDEVKALRALLTPAGKPTTEDGEQPSDAELERIARALFPDEAPDTTAPAEVPATAPAVAPETTVAATADKGTAVELTADPSPTEIALASRLDVLEKDNAKLRASAAETAYTELRDKLAHESHIPPAITDLCKPWLMSDQAIELSGGESRRPGEDIAKMLTAIGEHAHLLDLSAPTVFDGSTDPDRTEQADNGRKEWAKDFLREHGLS